MAQINFKQFVNSTRPTHIGKADKKEMDDFDILKIGITVGLFFGILFISIVCYFILDCIAKRYNKGSRRNGETRQNKIFSRLNLFSGGVFFATSFLHLLPEAKEEMQKFLELSTISLDFPTCEFTVSIGFFLVLIAEQLTSRLQKAFEARKKAKHLKSNQTPIFTADISINITTGDNSVKQEPEADDTKAADSLSVENKTEFESRDNKSTSTILCNDDTCTEYDSSPIEKLDSLDMELPNKRARRDNFVDVDLCTTNRNEITSSDKAGTSTSTSTEPSNTVSDCNTSMLTVHSHGSLMHKFKSENNLTKYNTVFSASKLAHCNCHLNNFNKNVNADTDVNNKITTTTGIDSYLKKAIEPSDSASTVQSSKREGYRAIILLVSLLFHSLFDGLALGLQDNPNNVYTILIAILLHKSLVAFSLTLKFYRAFPGRIRFIFICLFLFSIISPVGCVIGWLVSGSDSIHIVIRAGCSGILQSLATGTFLYVTFIEILGPELGHGQAKLISISFVFVGFLTLALLKFLL